MFVLSTASACAAAPVPTLDADAETYAKLVLAIEAFDPGSVDVYFGPNEWRPEARRAYPDKASIRRAANEAHGRLTSELAADTSADDRTRQRHLAQQFASLLTSLDRLDGQRVSFDREAELTYGFAIPPVDANGFAEVRTRLDALLPGKGALAERYQSLQRELLVPRERLQAVMRRAIEECRSRTVPFVSLPDQEQIDLEIVDRQPWSAYTSFRGNARSVVQLNTDVSLAISKVLDEACHETYPGHHFQYVLTDQVSVRERGWMEFAATPVRSPRAFLLEALASVAVDVAFTPEERLAFERDTLFPLAGLHPEKAELSFTVERTIQELQPIVIEGVRRYMDGALDRHAAISWLEEEAVMADPAPTLTFVDHYGSYVAAYVYGKMAVRGLVSETPGEPSQRWKMLTDLITLPRVPSDLANRK